MVHEHYDEITLRLTNIRDLFQVPDLNVAAGRLCTLSGLDQLIGELKPKSLSRRVRATIQLPQAGLASADELGTRTAIQHYCEAQIHQLTNELISLRWQGLKALQTGIVFLAVCLLLSTLFEGLTALPEFLRRILSEAFLIVGSVSLWHPTELLLYAWWPLWRDKQLYTKLKEMEVRIEAQETGKGDESI